MSKKACDKVLRVCVCLCILLLTWRSPQTNSVFWSTSVRLEIQIRSQTLVVSDHSYITQECWHHSIIVLNQRSKGHSKNITLIQVQQSLWVWVMFISTFALHLLQHKNVQICHATFVLQISYHEVNYNPGHLDAFWCIFLRLYSFLHETCQPEKKF